MRRREREPSAEPSSLELPDFSLVVLIGATGSGKTTFARKWFLPTEIVSSDECRGIVSDDPNDQSVSADAFALVGEIAARRLKNRRLTVIDATNVRASERTQWVQLARRFHALPVTIVFDPGIEVCMAHNANRADRNFGRSVPQRMIHEIRQSFRNLHTEGFRNVWRFTTPEGAQNASLVRKPLWTDRRDDCGPFDIIGDVHGCANELRALLGKLGYGISGEGDGLRVVHPQNRKLVFVGDLVDRGPATPEVLRIVMAAAQHSGAWVVAGNHDAKLARWLGGRKVTVAHGLQASIDQLMLETEAFRQQVQRFLGDLRSHYWLDGGALAVAHAGLQESMIGRGSPAVREFAMYGDTTGETDEFGLPVRRNWAEKYRGDVAVVYGHTPSTEAEWLNNTLCVDTGCVFGGRLTALQWPERIIVSVDAEKVWSEPVRPLSVGTARNAQALADELPDCADVMGRRWIETGLQGRIVVAQENAAAALEVMERFALPPQWLAYLPPTMSPVETSAQPGFLERPEEAFAFYRERGQKQVVLEEKHMGSRAVIALCRDPQLACERFGLVEPANGAIWTRTGRAFFSDSEHAQQVLQRMISAADRAGLWDEMETGWLLLDAEIMPWSAKASALIHDQYEPVALAAIHGLSVARQAAAKAAARGVAAVAEVAEKMAQREACAARYARAWAPYCWPVGGVDDLKVAPFHILASEGRTHLDKNHLWHMGIARRLASAGDSLLMVTDTRLVSLDSESECADAALWWEALTESGGEGMVVKPLDFIAHGERGLMQPALKVRGREYLRIIYGPEYDLPYNMERLRRRGLRRKRSLALREFALGHEALQRFVKREPLRRIHECVFAVLALESEPVDPRL